MCVCMCDRMTILRACERVMVKVVGDNLVLCVCVFRELHVKVLCVKDLCVCV